MRYYATPSSPRVRSLMLDGLVGWIDTPAQGNARPSDVDWCADNGCFGSGYPGDAEWLGWLAGQPQADRALCRFATAPDAVGDAAATAERSRPWLPEIRALGYPAAFVAQDGLETLDPPWDDLDALFIGGTTDWKLGPHARALAIEARQRGKWVHWGRVNTAKRAAYVAEVGADSADGTILRFGPDANLGRVLAWLREANDQDSMFPRIYG